MNNSELQAQLLKEKRIEIAESLILLNDANSEVATEILFTGGQCVLRSILSVGSTDKPISTDVKEIQKIKESHPTHVDANSILDLIFELENTNYLDKFILSKYYNSAEAPSLETLAELVALSDYEVCISLRVVDSDLDGKEVYSYHMGHIARLGLNDNKIDIYSRSDYDNGARIKRALEVGEPNDVYVFTRVKT